MRDEGESIACAAEGRELAQDGGGGWSAQAAVANAKANPMQVGIAAMMLFM